MDEKRGSYSEEYVELLKKNTLIEVKLEEIAKNLVSAKLELVEHLKFTINNIHEHLKENIQEMTKNLDDLKKSALTKEVLTQLATRHECEICRLENEKKYIRTKDAYWFGGKLLVAFGMFIAAIYAIAKDLIPMLLNLF